MGLLSKAVRQVAARTAPFCLGFPLAVLAGCTAIIDGSSNAEGSGATTSSGATGSAQNGAGTPNGGSTGGGVGPGENPDQGSPIQAAPTYA